MRAAALTLENRFENDGDGARRARTADLLGAIQALSQLSYGPAVRSLAALMTRPSPDRRAQLLRQAGKRVTDELLRARVGRSVMPIEAVERPGELD